MSDLSLRVYHRLPGAFRNVAASVRGLALRHWRFGPETERLVAEALERDQWSAQRWRTWQGERLALVLHRAATRVPYYREHWADRRRRGDRTSWERLENWPLLGKDVVRANPKAFVADDSRGQRMLRVQTSGTTSKPVSIYQTRDTVRAWYALTEARTRRWYGLRSGRDRWAVVGGQLVTPVAQRRPPFWVWNAALGQLYMSSYHLAPDLIPYYLDALHRYRIRYIEGYTSSLYSLAHEATKTGGPDLNLAVALTYAEPLAPYQRDVIARGLGAPVRETYGMAEAVTAASECDSGRMHLWPDAGILEVLEDGSPVPAGQTGEFVSTGLINACMPLIRYRLGDRGALSAQSGCSCGRTLPQLGSVEGRVDDVLYTADGRRIGRLDPIFKTDLPILEAQIVQEALGRVRVRYVPAPGFTAADGDTIVRRLRDRMGPVEVELERLAEIPRTANGKFRAVISKLSSPPNEPGAAPASAKIERT